MGTTDTAGDVAELAVVADVLGTGVTSAGADVADVEEAMLKYKQRWSKPCDKAGDAVGIATSAALTSSTSTINQLKHGRTRAVLRYNGTRRCGLDSQYTTKNLQSRIGPDCLQPPDSLARHKASR